MQKTAKILYGLNSITTIFIGALHTIAHYQDLVTAKIQSLLEHNIIVTGQEASIWNLWQGMSLMMGLLLIIVGLLHLVILNDLDKESYPPVGGSLVMMLMLIFVFYAGLNFFSSWQVVGASVGLILQSICLVLTVRGK